MRGSRPDDLLCRIPVGVTPDSVIAFGCAMPKAVTALERLDAVSSLSDTTREERNRFPLNKTGDPDTCASCCEPITATVEPASEREGMHRRQ